MIPLRLRVRNFMCYRGESPWLDLEGVHVACLCGENGAGKSALLDAITWALWGQTSRVRDQEHLVAMGAEEMEAELEFLVGEARYRVVRKWEKPQGKRAGRSLLELASWGGSDYVPVTEGSTRETQQVLNGIVRMDYDTFRNSAFLVQGHADEFTIKTPDKRKEVLAKVLDLEYYEKLEKRAREEARRCKDRAGLIDQDIQRMEGDLSHREGFALRLKTVSGQLEGKTARQEGLQSEIEKLRRQRQALEDKRRQADDAAKRLEVLHANIAEHRRRHTDGAHLVEAFRKTVAQGPAIEQEFQRYRQATAERERLDMLANRALVLSNEATRLREIIHRARSILEREQGQAESTVSDLKKRAAGKDSAKDQLGRVQEESRSLDVAFAALEERRGQVQAKADEVTRLQTENTNLKAQMLEISEKIAQLQRGEGSCPLCGTPLGLDRCTGIMESYGSEGTAKKAQYLGNDGRVKVLSAERQKLQAEVEAADKHLRARQHQLSASGGSLTETVRQAEQALALLPEAEARLAKLQKDLAAGAFARDEQQKLERVEAEAAALGYEPTAHERARKEADALRPAERAQRDLDEAQRRLPEEQGRLETLAKDIHLEEQLAGQERETVERLQAEARALPQVLSAVQGLEREQKALADEVNALRSEQGEVRGQLNRLMEVEQALGLRRRERQEAATEQGLYEDLVRAFGRSGVQALIIETAIPQIQDEANDLLGRMTDNRMHVKLDTLGTRKTREGPVETLDIKVSDELGTRPYETFSGGEAFRVNIALRIALSQLLARRAGAPLPTLFIDEGFGTQDTAARDKVVEAITAIQDQFQRILVITHIDEMKEQFPVRIEVTKTPEGSTFVVV